MTTRKQRKRQLDMENRRRQKQAADALDDAEAIVGPVRLPDGRHGDPEAVLGQAAKRLRQVGSPHARDLALDCEELADPELDESEDD